MNTVFWSEKTRWVVAAAGATVIVVVPLMLFRLPPASVGTSPPPPAAATARPIVQIAKATEADPVLAEEMALRDMRPLFLPIERVNVTLPLPRREPGRTFLDDGTLKLGISEAEISISHDLPPAATLADKPAEKASAIDALAADPGIGLAGFGRGQDPVRGLKPRGGFVEVRATATGRVVLSEALPTEARPAGDKAWEPLEMLAAIDAAGLATPLVITSSSRVEEVDAHFRQFLSRQFRIGERLPPGYYRIVIGP